MDSLLRQFNGDIHTKEAFKAFICDCIDVEGLRRIYAKEDVTAIKDARELIDKTFEKLEQIYGIKSTPKEPTNPAR